MQTTQVVFMFAISLVSFLLEFMANIQYVFFCSEVVVQRSCERKCSESPVPEFLS